MSIPPGEGSERSLPRFPLSLPQSSVPEVVLPGDEQRQPTVIDRLEQLRWIHLPIIMAMAALTLVGLPWIWRVAGAFQTLVGLPWHRSLAGAFQPYDALYLLVLPYLVLELWGLHTRTPPLPTVPQRTLDRLIICLVTKGTNPEVVSRTYRQLVPLCGPEVELWVVTDRQLPVPHLLVPATFQTRHARYKARALEYFRQQQRYGPGDWVLHLDEESVIDAESLRACQEYCRRSPFLYGQGPILYNNHEFWQHPIEAAADCVRVADDVGKFHLQLARLQRPIFGLHGSFLLVKGSLEDEITWDIHGSLVEDYAFAVECMRRGLGVGAVAGIVREQSPTTVADLLRQRRRWLVGMRGLSRLSQWARLWSVLWSASPLVRAATIAHVLTGTLSLPALVVGDVLMVTLLYLYLLGAVIQDVDQRTPLGRLLWRVLKTGMLFPVSYTLESAAVLWSFVSWEQKIGFQTVRK